MKSMFGNKWEIHEESKNPIFFATPRTNISYWGSISHAYCSEKILVSLHKSAKVKIPKSEGGKLRVFIDLSYRGFTISKDGLPKSLWKVKVLPLKLDCQMRPKSSITNRTLWLKPMLNPTQSPMAWRPHNFYVIWS